MQILNKFKLAENIATPFHRIYIQIPQKYFQSTNVLSQLSRDKKRKLDLNFFFALENNINSFFLRRSPQPVFLPASTANIDPHAV